MSRERLIELAEQRASLVERAGAEREKLAALVGRTDEAAAWFMAAQNLVQEIGRHPLFVIAGAAFLIALRPRRMLGLLLKGWSLYRFYRGARLWWLRFAAASDKPAPSRGY